MPKEGSSPAPRNPEEQEEEPEQPNTPSRGVKDDISDLTETLTRRLWSVASFLAPPPAESSSPRAASAEGDGEDAASPQSPRIAGIRSDLAEIGGRVRSGISMLQSNLAVAGISNIASSLLPFGQEEADEGEPVIGATEEAVVFVRHISTRPLRRGSISPYSSASAMQMVLRHNKIRRSHFRVLTAEGHQEQKAGRMDGRRRSGLIYPLDVTRCYNRICQ